MTPRKPSDLKVEAQGSLHPGFEYSKLKDTPIFKCPNKATESVWDQRRVDWLGPALPSDNKNALHQGHWAVFSGQQCESPVPEVILAPTQSKQSIEQQRIR